MWLEWGRYYSFYSITSKPFLAFAQTVNNSDANQMFYKYMFSLFFCRSVKKRGTTRKGKAWRNKLMWLDIQVSLVHICPGNDVQVLGGAFSNGYAYTYTRLFAHGKLLSKQWPQTSHQCLQASCYLKTFAPSNRLLSNNCWIGRFQRNYWNGEFLIQIYRVFRNIHVIEMDWNYLFSTWHNILFSACIYFFSGTG